MPCGPALINAVAGVLTDNPVTPLQIQGLLPGHYSKRAIRYAIVHLVAAGKAKRQGNREHGPVMAVEAQRIS